MRNCFNCKDVLVGRIDKKFCDGYCKSAYHYKENQKHQNIFFKRVESQIKLNRRLLREFNKSRQKGNINLTNGLEEII